MEGIKLFPNVRLYRTDGRYWKEWWVPTGGLHAKIGQGEWRRAELSAEVGACYWEAAHSSEALPDGSGCRDYYWFSLPDGSPTHIARMPREARACGPSEF